jgi:hypothetical protein
LLLWAKIALLDTNRSVRIRKLKKKNVRLTRHTIRKTIMISVILLFVTRIQS